MKIIQPIHKKMLKGVLPSISITIFILIVVSIFGFNLIYFLGSLALYQLVTGIYKRVSFKLIIKGIIKTSIIITIMIYTFKWLGAYGIIGFIVMILALALYKAFFSKYNVFMMMDDTEIMLFGDTIKNLKKAGKPIKFGEGMKNADNKKDDRQSKEVIKQRSTESVEKCGKKRSDA